MPVSALPGIMEPIFYLLASCERVRKVVLFHPEDKAQKPCMQTTDLYLLLQTNKYTCKQKQVYLKMVTNYVLSGILRQSSLILHN